MCCCYQLINFQTDNKNVSKIPSSNNGVLMVLHCSFLSINFMYGTVAQYEAEDGTQQRRQGWDTGSN